MKRVLVVAVCAGLWACDFDGAFNSYCEQTGRCDGGASSEDAGLGGGGGTTGGGGGTTTGGGGGTTGGGGGSTTGGGGGAMGGGGGGAMGGGGGTTGGGGGTMATLPGANQGDGGVMPGCAFNRLWITGFDTGETNDCTPVTISAQKPNGAGNDVSCQLPMTVVSDPTPGFTLYGDLSCTVSPKASTGRGARPSRFGTYLWYAGVTSSGFTITSSVADFTATATLSLDAGTGSVQLGKCNYLEISATGLGLPAAAAAETPVAIDLRQGGTGLTNCGADRFRAGDSSFFVGVEPSSMAQVSITASGPLFTTGVNVQLPVTCSGAGAFCMNSGECCSNACVGSSCQ